MLFVKLWVAKHQIADISIFLSPSGTFVSNVSEALKFETETACESYLSKYKSFIDCHASLEEIPEERNNCLLSD